MTDIKKKLLDVIYNGIDPESNPKHAFVAGVIYEKALATISDTKKEA